MVVAVLPARGGSQGIPGKNLALVGGRSLLARSITTGLAVVDEVVVSTDDPAIAAEAVACGAKVLDRPADLAGGAVTSEAVLLQVIDEIDVGDWFVFLQCTSPFVTGADLARVVEPVADGHADVSFAAAEFHGHVWGWDDGRLSGVNFDPWSGPTAPRQERPPQLLETGAGYALRADGFRRSGCRFYGRVVAVGCETWRGIDIDTPEDLAVARAAAHLFDR